MMSAKIIAAMVAATAFLAPITSASAQTQEFPRYWGGGFAGYYGYGGYYGTAYPLGDGIGVYNYAPGPGVYVYVPAGIYYAPGYYNYAPAYVAPVYTGWNNVWNYW